MTQFSFFGQDVARMLGKYKIRIVHIWLSRVFWGLLLYRWERGWYLLLGRPYELIRVIFIPIYNLIQAYANIDIHYKADIRGGIIVLHPSAGVVISGLAVIGANLTLTGGNIIGAKKGSKHGDVQLGDNCTLGANAVIIGPVKLGTNINIGALACVVRDCETNDVVLTGVPAKISG